MRIVFSWDDGAPEDLKLIALHEKFDIPGLFFVPTRNSEGRAVLTPEQIRNARSDLVSFGGHTENHVYLTTIPLEKVEGEIVHNKEYLENILGEEIENFCLPGGQYNQNILDTAFSHYKTIRTADTMNFRKCKDSLVIPTFHFYPRTYKSRIGNSLRHRSYRQLPGIALHPYWSYLQMIEIMLKSERNSDSDIVIWGHSWEIEEFNLWDDLEELFKVVKDRYSQNCVQYQDICR